MTAIEKRVAAIEERNKRVELDKSWETSITRRMTIAVLTYGVVGSYLSYLNFQSPWLGAVVPVAGFLLSTLALDIIRKFWER